MGSYLNEQIRSDLIELCVNIGERHPGSQGNQQATKYLAGRMAIAGFEVSTAELDCIDWEAGDIILKVGEQSIEAFIGPYSNSCEIEGRFQTASSITELARRDFTGKVMVLYGELGKEQLAAKNFMFYNPDHHKRIVELLEQQNPLAVLAITGCNPATTGALNPFPLIEDGDFNIPSAYMAEQEGEKVLSRIDEEIYLRMESKRIPSKAFNVAGVKKGRSAERLVFCAHIDTKKGTPGALDNGSGVCVLLALAELLKGYEGHYTIELLAINGEDYYAYPGGMRYLADNQEHFEQIFLVVNSDGAGSKGSRTTYCCFNATEAIEQVVSRVFKDERKFIPTEPWYQSDHAMFAINGRPAVALTTEAFKEIWSTIAHTSKDTIDGVDINTIADIARALRELVDELNAHIYASS